jgi:hypothetical protein
MVFLLRLLPQVIVDHSRLHTRQFSFGIDLQDLIKILREINDHSDITALPGKTRAATSGDYGRPVAVARRHGFHDILNTPGNDHANRYLAVVGGIGRIYAAATCIKSYLAADVLSQVRLQSSGANLRKLMLA